MKKLAFLLLMSGLPVHNADAAVKLERLEDFDPGIHRITVSIQAEVTARCPVDTAALDKEVEGLLGVFGFQAGSYEDSQLEFAVAVKGLKASKSPSCGLMFTSMVRQIPLKKILRLSPGSNSERYRLWAVEHVITVTPHEIQRLLQNQSMEDVKEFSRVFWESTGRQ
jgi:hypothetical protein